MLNVGRQPNDKVISHWQDASSAGILSSACATDSLSIQNHLPDYSDLHILRQWDHSFSHDKQFIRPPDWHSQLSWSWLGCVYYRWSSMKEKTHHRAYHWQDVITWKQMMTPPECHPHPTTTLACGLGATSPDGRVHTWDKHKRRLSEASP